MPSMPRSPGHQYSVGLRQHFGGVLGDYLFTVDPVNLHVDLIGDAAVAQGLGHAEISVMQSHILAHEGNFYLAAVLAKVENRVHHLPPLGEVGLDLRQPQTAQHRRGQSALLKSQRNGVKGGGVEVFHHALLVHVAEGGDFFLYALFQRYLRPADDDVRLDAQAKQLFDAVLCGLGFLLAAGGYVWHQRNVDVETVVPADLALNLAYGFKEGQALYVAHGAADFGNDEIHVVLAGPVYPLLDFVGDVGNYLHRAAEIVAPALLVYDAVIHLSAGDIGVAVQIFVHKPLIVSQIKVGFGAVVGDKDLAVLVRAHGAGVKIDVRVELLYGYFVAPALEQTAQRCRRNALAKAGNHAARHKDVFCLHFYFPFRIGLSRFNYIIVTHNCKFRNREFAFR